MEWGKVSHRIETSGDWMVESGVKQSGKLVAWLYHQGKRIWSFPNAQRAKVMAVPKMLVLKRRYDELSEKMWSLKRAVNQLNPDYADDKEAAKD